MEYQSSGKTSAVWFARHDDHVREKIARTKWQVFVAKDDEYGLSACGNWEELDAFFSFVPDDDQGLELSDGIRLLRNSQHQKLLLAIRERSLEEFWSIHETPSIRYQFLTTIPLYKYLASRWVDAFFATGSVRIGTLFDFRKEEIHGRWQGDTLEGTKETVEDFGKVDWAGPDDIPERLSSRIHMAPGAKIDIRVQASYRFESPDFYLYCVASEALPQEVARRQFNGADSCIVINEPESFFLALTESLSNRGIFFGWGPCLYSTRTEPYERQSPYHPALMKEPKHAVQKEVRALWMPKKSGIAPETLECPKAIQFCSRFGEAP